MQQIHDSTCNLVNPTMRGSTERTYSHMYAFYIDAILYEQMKVWVMIIKAFW